MNCKNPSLSIKTKERLRNLEDSHLINLPSKNALTFLDTQIISLSLFVLFVLQKFRIILSFFDVISWETSFILFNIFDLSFNIVMCVMFPIYIILKTRRYLPRLWDDASPFILQNNDFYAVRMSQVNQEI